MGFLELLLVAISLAMDAFSVSICGSMALKPESRLRGALTFGSWFGAFQFIMPALGYFAAYWAREYIMSYSHWVGFLLLMYIGVGMLRESTEDVEPLESYSVQRMSMLALATSIDALAVGVSLALTDANIWVSSAVIGAVCFAISFFGGIAGFRLGDKLHTQAEIVGGSVLCLIGLKILLEGLGLL